VSTSITGADAGEFSVQSSDCPTTLDGGASCTATVAFSPITLGEKTATFTAAGAPGGTASLVALGAPLGVTIVSAVEEFGEQAVGSSTTKTFRVVNTTESGAEINSVSSGLPFSLDLAADFTCVLSIGVIQPHRWCTISIAFRPAATGFFGRTLTAGGTFGSASATMNGTAVAARPSARASGSTPTPTSVALRDGVPVVTRD